METFRWMLNRCRCYCFGHRNLSVLASYGAVLPDGRLHELFFCNACDSPVWVNRADVRIIPKWDNHGI